MREHRGTGLNPPVQSEAMLDDRVLMMHRLSLSRSGEGQTSCAVTGSQQARQAQYTQDYLQHHDRTSRGKRPFSAWAFEGIGKYASNKREKEWKSPEPRAAGNARGDQDHENQSAEERGRVAEVAGAAHEDIQKQRGTSGECDGAEIRKKRRAGSMKPQESSCDRRDSEGIGREAVQAKPTTGSMRSITMGEPGRRPSATRA